MNISNLKIAGPFILVGVFFCGLTAALLFLPAPESKSGAVECPAPAVQQYKPMTNDEIIAETNKCQQAGMIATTHQTETFGSQTVLVICAPKPQ